jgi:ubiquinone/menaquinone biosynthesis C-methylase UbiE
MEPDSVADYSKQEYWDRRYETEPEYDWFKTVYPSCLEAVCKVAHELREKHNRPIRVLHLGTGNSRLVADVAMELKEAVSQVAVDYSPVVIERMASTYCEVPNVSWAVGDVRDLRRVQGCDLESFDLVIDKGTMDALQADKDDPDMEDNIDRMLIETSEVMKPGAVFLQFTWEIAYYRLHYTRNVKYKWVNDHLAHEKLPGSDMYSVFRYVKDD